MLLSHQMTNPARSAAPLFSFTCNHHAQPTYIDGVLTPGAACDCAERATAEQPATMLHFAAIVRKATELLLPKAYASDLIVHDHAELATRPVSEPFIWAVRAEGTYISGRHASEAKALETVDGPEWKVFRWDGARLVRVRT